MSESESNKLVSIQSSSALGTDKKSLGNEFFKKKNFNTEEVSAKDKKFNLDSAQIKTKLNALIESKKTTVVLDKTEDKKQHKLPAKPSTKTSVKPSNPNTSSGNADAL